MLTLLEKIYGRYNKKILKSFENKIKSIFKNLEVNIKIKETTKDNWIQLEISGLETAIVIKYINQKFGIAPISISKIKKFNVIKGKIIDSGKVGYGIYVDIGVYIPKHIDVLIPLHVLRSQLINGKKLSLKEIIELFKLHNNFPLNIQIIKINLEKNQLEGKLTINQCLNFQKIVFSELDMALVIGITFNKLKKIINKKIFKRDIIKIINLGLLENYILFKIGVNGNKVINKLEQDLTKEKIYYISPKKIINALKINETSEKSR